MQSHTLSVPLDAFLSEKLEKVAHATQRTPLSVVLDAVNQYVAVNEWNLEAARNYAQTQSARLLKSELLHVRLCDITDVSTNQSLAS